ncbi:MAG: S41 family peptidase [Acutalibacteraceae bacterium]
MNKKISLGLTIALIIVSVTATFAITMSVSQRMYNNLITDLPNRAQMYDAVEEIDNIVRSNYYGEIDEAFLDSNLENGYINGLNDPYSYYMNADAYKLYSSKLEGRSAGIGVEVETDPESGYLLVTEVYPNSPAQTEGLKKGDKIVAIDGETVTVDNATEMTGKLSGVKLTSVSLTYRRDDVDKSVNVVRGYTNQTVSYELIGTTGYIKISAFYKNTVDQLEKAVTQLKKDGAKSLIFDVRSTYDGTIEYTCSVIDYLVPTATDGNKAIATLVNKNGETVKTYSSEAKDITMPMAVLVDSDTAGYGELFACDLRDFGKAFLIGEKTAGRAAVQETFELSDGGAVVLTTSKMLPYISESFDGEGLTPDNEVFLPGALKDNLSTLEREDDTQLQAALSMLADNSAE